ncbi:phosphoribosyltransferase [Limnohabitans sp. DM1]|uniref:phosphoribosyltransferase n=1 Tax=Limnohabitans sp. DM1 TaxID=1597955 RepID=UPI000B250E36|nr:phosphoribosyltransferase family protein [Limnohabitans sp. DM1]
MFKDRLDAAQQLAHALIGYRGQHPLILAIPRGAVPMGQWIARQLGGELDVVLVRKLRAPHQDELAVGAMDEHGNAFIAPWAHEVGADAAYLDLEKARQMHTLRQRRALYTPVRTPIDPKGRLVIVVDDGLATGATMLAALQAVRRQAPAKLVCAIPVASAHALRQVRALADDTICLSTPDDFQAVAQFYRHFPAVEDSEAVAVLREHLPPQV